MSHDVTILARSCAVTMSHFCLEHIQLHAALLDGTSTTLMLSPERSCWDLLRALERSLGTIIDRLVVNGVVVSNLIRTLLEQGICNNDTITCTTKAPYVFGKLGCCVLKVSQGSLNVLRRTEPSAEDMRSLECVHSIAMTRAAVAALTTSGTVITWGDALAGGDSQSVQSQLSDKVRYVTATEGAFAALLDSKLVVTWPTSSNLGGNCAFVESCMQDVHYVIAARRGFCAIMRSGQVAMWGDDYGAPYGVTPRSASVTVPPLQIVDVTGVGSGTFVCLLESGRVMCWDAEQYQEIFESFRLVEADIHKSFIANLIANSFAICATTDCNTKLYVWGHELAGGSSSNGIQELCFCFRKLYSLSVKFS